MRRVVVTGMGIVSPLGVGVEHNWRKLLGGASGIRALPNTFYGDLGVRVAGIVPDIVEDPDAGFDLTQVVDAKDRKKMDRFILFATAASLEAIRMARLEDIDGETRKRVATVIGSGIGGFPAITGAVRLAAEKGARRLSPFTIPSFLANLAAGQVSIQHGYMGPIGTPVTACAAGVQAIGDAARLIRSGECDVAVCGGAEACIDLVSLGAFSAARALSNSYGDEPHRASRPFDQARDGFVMGEGAGILVVEEYERAIKRGVPILAEIAGYGTTADAYHMTAGPEDGSSAARAMRIALDQANIRPADVGHLNAHSTSTPVGDKAELNAIASVFGRGKTIAISATKSSTGHLLGAAGGIEAIFTILALRDQFAPPTLNLEAPDDAAKGLDIVMSKARRLNTSHAISNGFGFGGVNASVVFSAPTGV